MNCTKCLREIPEGIRYCPYCGRRQTGSGCAALFLFVLMFIAIGTMVTSCIYLSWPKDKPVKPNQTVEEKIVDICNAEFRTEEKSYTITDNQKYPGSKDVYVQIKALKMPTPKFTGEIVANSGVIFLEKLYGSGLPIANTEFIAMFNLMDKYGQESPQVVLRIKVNAETAKKVNWKNALSLNPKDIFEEYWLHPALR